MVGQAVDVASRAAVRCGVRVREAATVRDCAAVRSVLDRVWDADPTNPAATVELLRAYTHTGQYVVLAEDLTCAHPFPDNVIAASVGFLAVPLGRALHSNVTGVLPPGLGRSLGFAVKLHQRAWALQHGLDLVSWTFDPLIRRNAWFNLAKLAAVPQHYLANFYGDMADGINAGDESDRLYLHWPLAAPAVVAACAGLPQVLDVDALLPKGIDVALAVGGRGEPVLRIGDPVGSPPAARLIQIPPDVEPLRLTDPTLARAWRSALREALGGSLSQGWTVRGMGRDGWYVLEAASAEGKA